VTTLRAAIQYIYGLQNLLEEIQTGTLDLARYQLSEAELPPASHKQPATAPHRPSSKSVKSGSRQNAGVGAAQLRKATAARRKPAYRPPLPSPAGPANSKGGGALPGNLKSSPVTLSMKGPPVGSNIAVKKPDPKLPSVAAASSPPGYVLPLQPRDASHVLRRDYATGSTTAPRRQMVPTAPPPTAQSRLLQATATSSVRQTPQSPTTGCVVDGSGVSSLSPNLLSMRPLPVSALFPKGQQPGSRHPSLPPLQTLRQVTSKREAAPRKVDLEEGRSGGQASFYCTTAGTRVLHAE
jgi:hypothetical protein